MDHSRRELLAIGGLALPVGGAAASIRQEAIASPVTPSQRTGPFYPVVREGENAIDLTRDREGASTARGRRVHVGGRVLDPSGRPIGSAIVLVWQADSLGKYGHPSDGGSSAADPGFGGHAMLRTARDGGFDLTTIHPGAYADNRSASGLRTPHIHFEVIGEEGRLITEMYFPDEPLNDDDANIAELIAAGGDPRRLVARREGSSEADVLDLRWQMVLAAR